MADGAIVLWRRELARPSAHSIVVFLHGWSPILTAPEAYGAWIEHLTRQSTVVFPVYLDAHTTPHNVRRRVVAGITAGLNAIGAAPSTLVVVGHTTGGALALDYTAVAAAGGDLPRPDAVFAIYPARNPTIERIPAAQPTAAERGTIVEIVGGDGDPVVKGAKQARQMFRALDGKLSPDDRRFIAVGPAASPTKSDVSSRQAFWVPLDRLIAEASRNGR